MKLIVRNSHTFNRAISIDADFLQDLQRLILEYCQKVKCSGTLKNKYKVIFDSIDEVLQFENKKFSRLIDLRIIGFFDQEEIVDIYFHFNTGIFTAYSTTIRYEYTFSREDDEDNFLIKIKKILKHATCNYWWIGKIGSVLITILYLSGNVLYNLFYGSLIEAFANGLVLTKHDLIIFLEAIFLTSVLKLFDRFIWLSIFEPLTFRIGKGEQEFQKKEKIRNGLFWSGLVAIIIGAIFKFIL